MTEKITLEVAESEFARWAEAMDLARKLDPAGLDADDKKSLAEQKKVLLDMMLAGRLMVDDHGQMVYTPVKGKTEPITFYEPDGACLMAVDTVGKSGTHDVGKTIAVLAATTKTSRQTFSEMKNRDFSVCQAIISLFLAR